MKTKIITTVGTTIGISALALSLGQSTVNAQEKGVVTANALNVRSGPGAKYNIKGCLFKGNTIPILETENGWVKVTLTNGTTGWVNKAYVKIYSTTTDEVSAPNIQVNCRARLNVRSGPSTSYSKKTTIGYGEVYKKLEKENGWYKIELSNGDNGWVCGDYVSITNESVNSTIQNTNSNTQKGEAIVQFAMAQLGKPYAWGANGPNYFDCSGFTRYVYLNAGGVSLYRVSYEQARQGTAVSINNMKKGDLLYFATVTPGRTSHVGIYIGNNQFIHASGSERNPDKVKISSLSGYYGKVLLGIRRIV